MAFRRRARRDWDRERLEGVSEISESVCSLVCGGFEGVCVVDIVVVGGWVVGRRRRVGKWMFLWVVRGDVSRDRTVVLVGIQVLRSLLR